MNAPPFTDTVDGLVWHEGLKCCIEKLEIDFVRRRAALWLPAMNCTDMAGAIRLVERIDRRVVRIYTLAGGDRDTCYSQESGEWVSIWAGR